MSQGVSGYPACSPPAADEFPPGKPKNLIRNFVYIEPFNFATCSYGTDEPDWILTFFNGFTICSCAERLFSIEFQNCVITHHAFAVQNFRRSWCSNCRPHWLKIRSRFWCSKFWTARRLNFKILIHWAWFCVTSSDILSNSSGNVVGIQVSACIGVFLIVAQYEEVATSHSLVYFFSYSRPYRSRKTKQKNKIVHMLYLFKPRHLSATTAFAVKEHVYVRWVTVRDSLCGVVLL